MIPASCRDLQYQSRLLARELERRGCRPFLALERPGLDRFHPAHWRRLQEEAAPHGVFTINRLYNDALHPDLPLVSWWQDPMPEIADGRPLPWRERDAGWSLCPAFDPLLTRSGARHVSRQSFCVDTTIFHERPEVARQEKVVVIASSYAVHLDLFRSAPQQVAMRRALGELTERFEAGEPITDQLLREVEERYGMTFATLFWKLFHFLVRDLCVRWLCRRAGELPVEVWGNFWERDPVVRPFHKGALSQGEAVARAYNGARYSLVAHPFDLQSQRMAEVAACGAIPVVYDCRYRAEPPHWDPHCLWFRTESQLADCLGKHPPLPPQAMARDKGYDRLAQRLEETIRAMLRGELPP